MRHSRYNNHVNKFKKLYLVAAAVFVLGGAGTAYALQPEDAPAKTPAQQIVASEPVEQQEATEPVESPPSVVETPVEPEPEPEPVETLQEKIKREVEEVAIAKGMDGWGKDMVIAQSHCMDKLIIKNGGYEDETKAQSYANLFTVGKVNDEGKTYRMYFSDYSCSKTYFYAVN